MMPSRIASHAITVAHGGSHGAVLAEIAVLGTGLLVLGMALRSSAGAPGYLANLLVAAGAATIATSFALPWLL